MRLNSILLFISICYGCCFAAAPENEKSLPPSEIISGLAGIMVNPDRVLHHKMIIFEILDTIIFEAGATLLEDLKLTIDDEENTSKFEQAFSTLFMEMHEEYRQLFLENIDLKELLLKTNAIMLERHFTPEELIELGHFFSSPAGVKYLRLETSAAGEISEILTEFMPPLLDKFQNIYMEKHSEAIMKLYSDIVGQ
jgi:hypothetical protein